MTTVTLSAGGGKYAVKCDGHADTPEVCAAVSALVQALQGWLHATGAIIEREDIQSGNCEITFIPLPFGPMQDIVCDAVYELVSIGFLRLHATAPEQIKVIFSDDSEINADTGGKSRG